MLPNNKTQERDPLLRTSDAADYLTLKSVTLEAWRVRGDGPEFIKLGRAVRYRLSSLDAFAESNVRRNTSKPA